MKRRTLLVGLLLVCCSKSDQAVDPVWGKQPCNGCGMIVENKRTAAEILTNDGERLFFDDPGCMVMWLESHHASRSWAMDANRGTWIDATRAHWKSGATTPMDYGWEATSAEGSSFEEMRTKVRARSDR
jgi:hypothetical protein